jgi:hypothetical protein
VRPKSQLANRERRVFPLSISVSKNAEKIDLKRLSKKKKDWNTIPKFLREYKYGVPNTLQLRLQ